MHMHHRIYHVTTEAKLRLEFEVESKGMVVITGSDEWLSLYSMQCFPAVWLILAIRLLLQVTEWRVWVQFSESEPSVWEFYGMRWGRVPLYLFLVKLIAREQTKCTEAYFHGGNSLENRGYLILSSIWISQPGQAHCSSGSSLSQRVGVP